MVTGSFSPVALFANGESGWTRLPGTPYGVSYQERSGASATTICANGDAVGTFKDLIKNTYWTASADARRPIFSVGSYISHDFDGVDDCLIGPTTDLTGTAKVTTFHAVECDNAAGTQIISEFSSNFNSVPGTWLMDTSDTAAGDFSFGLRNSSSATARRSGGNTLPNKVVLSCVMDLTKNTYATFTRPRVNGVTPSLTNTGTQTTGTAFANQTPYAGARGDASLRFNGRIIAEIVVGRECTPAEITATEQYLAVLAGLSF
jgi:hypothetical protein